MKKLLICLLSVISLLYISGCSSKEYTITYIFNNEVVHEQNVSYKEEFKYYKYETDDINQTGKEYYRWTDNDSVYLYGTTDTYNIKEDLTLYSIYRYEDNDSLNKYTFDNGEATFTKFKLDNTSYTIPSKVHYENEIYEVSTIASSAFTNNSTLTKLTIPSGVTTIATSAFSNCSALKIVTIPLTVNSVGNGIFSSCNFVNVYMEHLVEPDSWGSWSGDVPVFWGKVEGVDYDTIDNITYLIEDNKATIIQTEVKDDIVIPETINFKTNTYNVTSIGEYAFANNSQLTSITIPNTIKTIMSRAFYNCSSLTSITIPSTVDTIESDAFYSKYNLVIYTDTRSKPTNWDAKFCNSSSSIVYYDVKENEDYFTIDDITYLIQNNEVVITKVNNKEEFTISETIKFENKTYDITTIGSYAFSYNTQLNTIKFTDNITTIGAYAFSNCTSLTSIDFNNVTTIGSNAFRYCTSLTSIKLGNSITLLNAQTFAYCTSLITVDLSDSNITKLNTSAFSNCTKLSNILLPNTLTEINTYVFQNCTALKAITIPDSVTYVGTGAFYNCEMQINFNGNKDEWSEEWDQELIIIENN